jgi:hypothetical protein
MANEDAATLVGVLAALQDLNTKMVAIDKKTEANTLAIGHLEKSPHDNKPVSSGSNIDRPPRFQKLDFPKYDSKGEPLPFLNRCELYFHQQRIVEEEKVWMASFNLEGTAQLWYTRVQREEGVPNWRRFSELLNLRYGPHLRSNPLGELPPDGDSGGIPGAIPSAPCSCR